MLKTTMSVHKQQNGKKGAYEVHPDNQMSLWNMIESYKNERHDLKQVQIAQKSSNAAVQFRSVNQAQKEMEIRQRKQAEVAEKDSDKKQLCQDMQEFGEQIAKENERRQITKKSLNSELTMAMKHREDIELQERTNQAYMDELLKKGPPMMQEIQHNQERLIDNTKKINQMQGSENYVLMLNNRNQAKKQRAEDLAEYQAKYKEDLMVRLSQRNNREMKQRFERFAQDQKHKEAAATANGKIKFVDPLADAEMRDFEKARVVLEEKEEEDRMAEEMLKTKRNQ